MIIPVTVLVNGGSHRMEHDELERFLVLDPRVVGDISLNFGEDIDRSYDYGVMPNSTGWATENAISQSIKYVREKPGCSLVGLRLDGIVGPMVRHIDNHRPEWKQTMLKPCIQSLTRFEDPRGYLNIRDLIFLLQQNTILKEGLFFVRWKLGHDDVLDQFLDELAATPTLEKITLVVQPITLKATDRDYSSVEEALCELTKEYDQEESKLKKFFKALKNDSTLRSLTIHRYKKLPQISPKSLLLSDQEAEELVCALEEGQYALTKFNVIMHGVERHERQLPNKKWDRIKFLVDLNRSGRAMLLDPYNPTTLEEWVGYFTQHSVSHVFYFLQKNPSMLPVLEKELRGTLVWVKIANLQSAAGMKLNGKLGKVLSQELNQDGRHQVKVKGMEKIKLIKPANLEPYE